MKFTVTIPEKISLNRIYAGVHWTKRMAWKDQYYYAVQEAEIEPYQGKYPIRAHYHFKLRGCAIDASNCAFMVKCIEDALVSAGIIPDDNPKYIGSITLISEKAPKVALNTVEVQFIPM